MSITDELRKWLKSLYTPNSATVKDEGEHIADRIDAEHEQQCAESWMRGHDAWAAIDRGDEMAERGWVKLPVDADGVPIRVGDVMEFSAFEIEKPVTHMVDGIGQGVFFAWCGERGYQQHEAKRYRHYHEPTVEDVLREMHAKLDEVTALYVGEAIDSDERDSDEARIFAEYAAKLQLKEG